MGYLTDTHCHLNLNTYAEDLAQVLERAWAAGVERILVPGIDAATCLGAVALAEHHPNLYAAAGIHPHNARTWSEDALLVLREVAQHPKVVAIGEIGLDYYHDRSPRDQQQKVFRAQLELAATMNLPVILHNRDAWDDFWFIVRSWLEELKAAGSPLAARPGVLHSFDGSLSQAQEAAGSGFWIGISGPVTFHNALERQTMAAQMPIERLLIETDSPYLTPHPHRGRRNEPAHVVFVAEKLAELHGISRESVSTATWNNAARLLNWGAIS